MYVTAIGYWSLCGLKMNWQLVDNITRPSPHDSWDRLQ